MWELQESLSTETNRVFRESTTATECKIKKIYTDKMGNVWWGFHDLFQIPYLRTAMAKSIADMYEANLTKKDLLHWVNEFKAQLRGNEIDKYEKCFAKVLEVESIINAVADPLSQTLALATVYILKDDERIDHFTTEMAEQKLKVWAMDNEAQTFFLTWHIGATQNFMRDLKDLSKIALNSSQAVNQIEKGKA